MKYEIIIKGEASTDYFNLKELNGIDCQDCFSEYFDDTSYSNDVTGGYMFFKYENGKLMTYTTYDSNRKLTPSELENLSDYTQGQWSDGIGEGFEQYPCGYDDNGDDIYVSPWFFGQEVEVEQIEKS
jgi:hypothetical protein